MLRPASWTRERSCAFFDCPNFSTVDHPYRMFKFPTDGSDANDVSWCKLWIQRSCNPDLVVCSPSHVSSARDDFVCEDHFEDSQFLLKGVLKKNAVPKWNVIHGTARDPCHAYLANLYLRGDMPAPMDYSIKSLPMAGLPIGYLTRKEIFSACHRLHSPHLTDEENKNVYGKCNNYHGHGHNYTLEVTLRGPIDYKTGMVMNINDLKTYINKSVMDVLDHRNLDKDVPYFKDVVSTTEHVAVFIWDGLKSLLPDPSLLYEVKIFETEKNIIKFRGEYSS